MILQRRPSIFLLIIISYIIFLSITNVVGKTTRARPRSSSVMIDRDLARYKWISNKEKSKSNIMRRMTHEEQPMPEEATAQQNEEEAMSDEPEVPMEERQGPPKSKIKGSVKLPLFAAADYQVGQYFVELNVGTPPQKLRMIIDTGSDLTWVKCKNLPKGTLARERGFEASLSSSYSIINCSCSFCKQDFQIFKAMDICPNPAAPCYYNMSYGINDGDTTALGMFGKDTTTLPTTTGDFTTLKNVLVGCTESYNGTNMTATDGILGLSVNPYSFSAYAVSEYGGTFSYCLVDHLSSLNKASYLVFGENKEKAPLAEYIRYTSLRVYQDSSFFWLEIKGVSFGKKMLDIPKFVWQKNADGGTIIDSGTSGTYWTDLAYRPIMDVIIAVLAKDHPTISPEYLGDGKTDFEYCFNSTLHPFDRTTMPRLWIHFKDGARFEPHVNSYIIQDSSDVMCIGFFWGPGSINIIGNILQQNYLWEYDLHHQNLGFYPSTCT